MIEITRIKEYTPALAEGLGKLMPTLSSKMDNTPIPKNVIESITKSDYHQIFVAYDGEIIVGASVLSLIMGIDKNFASGPNAYLESFVTDATVQGKGIGSAIWEEMLKWCREKQVGKMEFTSNYKRESAHVFYAKKGCEIYDTAFFQYKF